MAPETLSPDLAARLAEFARACQAATRVVSIYPPGHPAIESSLARMVAAAGQAVAGGPLGITVLPGDLAVNGRGLSRPDPAVTALADVMHQHHIGVLMLRGTLTTGEWHAFLSLLARDPEEVRAEGGISRAWLALGGGPIDLKEIDYANVLLERTGTGEAASWERIIESCLEGDDRAGLNDQTLAGLLEIARDPARLVEFTGRLEERGRARADAGIAERRSLVQLMHGLANFAARQGPQELDTVLRHMAGAATHLLPDTMLALMTDPPPRGGAGSETPMLDLARELRSRLTDDLLGRFVAERVVRDRGATDRLATALRALVPDTARREQVLALAATKATASAFSRDPQFEQAWATSKDLLMSYSDADYVATDYADELMAARSQVMEVEELGDDPPERILAWRSTIRGDEVHALDQRLICDLLAVEERAEAWTGVLDVAVERIEQFVLVGDLALARQLLESVSTIARAEDSPFRMMAGAGLDRLASGPLAHHLVLFVRQAADAETALAGDICHAIGPSLIGPLAAALATEDHPRTVRRLCDVLIGFGPAARACASGFCRSPNPAVRRAAVDLLRALGDDESLVALRALLDDAEPLVQREAFRAMAQIGSASAYEMLDRALASGAPRTRDAIMQALGALRDPRAAPLLVHILTHASHRGPRETTYVSAIGVLGRLGGSGASVTMLHAILHGGEWWAPRRTARIRAAAALALRATGAEAADRVLHAALTEGTPGVKRAARAALAEPAPPSAVRRAG